MLASSLRNVLIGLVLSFTVVGTSALVVTNFERDPVLHRRHAHAIAIANNDLVARAPEPEPISPAPRISLAARRALRQKRCISRLNAGSGSSASSSSSSTSVAPTVNAPVNAPPAPTVDEQPAPTPQPPVVEQPAGNNGGGGGGSGEFTGELTYYDTGLGACGRVSTDNDMIAAASMLLFDGFDGYPIGANPNNNPICGRRVNIYFEGKSVNVELVDRCVGCAKYDLDLSPHAFELLASKDRGRLRGATWSWA